MQWQAICWIKKCPDAQRGYRIRAQGSTSFAFSFATMLGDARMERCAQFLPCKAQSSPKTQQSAVLARVRAQESLNAAKNLENAAWTALEEIDLDSESEGSVNNTTAADISKSDEESEGARGFGPPAAAAADSTGIS